jgi:curved DNA-binding protein CbpA
MAAPTPYDVLGVSPRASDAEIRDAYRTAALRLHPDRHGGDKRAEEAMRRVNEAWALIGSVDRRRTYDQRFSAVLTDEYRYTADDEAWSSQPQPRSRSRHVGVWALLLMMLAIMVLSAYAATPAPR